MIETELKITLDAAEMARLKRHPALAGLRSAPRRGERLVSIYVDTAEGALAQAGIALRLRRIGRNWVQTAKSARQAGGAGFFSQSELEIPAPGGRLALDGPDETGVFAAIAAARGDAPLAPVFETRVRRTIERLRLEEGVVELALDEGEIVAGEARAPILEAEMELVEGEVGALFALGRRLFATGPVQFSRANKAALGYRLAREGRLEPDLRARGAGRLAYGADATTESVARDVFRDCFAQVAENMVVVARSEAIEGPHQLRVGLRRLRTAFSVFAPSLGEPALKPLSDAARDLGQVAGRLRDADVLVDQVVRDAAGYGLDAAARDALVAALSARRDATRAAVRAELAGPAATTFLFDLMELIEARGWLSPADYSQTARLASPIAAIAPRLLDKRHAKVLKMGRRIEKLDDEGLHELRKELKKLRYAADVLDPIYPGKRVAEYLKALKDMQDTFGTLNDAAMAVEALAGPDAPVPGDAAAQRGAGWVLGTLAVRVGDDRPKLFKRWAAFAATRPFWS